MTEHLKMHEIYIHYIYLSKQSFNELFLRHTVLQFSSISNESSALDGQILYYTFIKIGPESGSTLFNLTESPPQRWFQHMEAAR